MIEPPHTHVHSERTVYDGRPWLRVTRNEITTPDGVDRSHHAVRLNSVATVTLVDEHQRALVLRRHRWIVRQVGFESPGGIVDPHEAPEACARRELLEETGFEAGHLELVADLEPMPGLVETRHFIYVGRDPRQLGAPTDAEEAGQLVWVPLASASDLLVKGQLLGTGTAVGMLSAAALYGGHELAYSPGQQVVTVPQTP